MQILLHYAYNVVYFLLYSNGEDAARKWLQTEGRNNLKELNKCIVETATAIESEKG